MRNRHKCLRLNSLCSLLQLDYLFQVVQKGYDKVLVLEDDIRFVPNFRDEFKKIITDINFLHDWDFV